MLIFSQTNLQTNVTFIKKIFQCAIPSFVYFRTCNIKVFLEALVYSSHTQNARYANIKTNRTKKSDFRGEFDIKHVKIWICFQ